MMAELLISHTEMGRLKAELSWIECGDPDGVSKRFKNALDGIANLEKRINISKTNLDLILDDEELLMFHNECMTVLNQEIDKQEIAIEMKFRPCDIGYNMKAIVVRTEKHIPEDILIGLSYGWKFMYPFVTNMDNMHEVASQLALCIDESVEPLAQHEVYRSIAQIISKRKVTTLDDTVQWLRFLSKRARFFFKQNKDIFATRSDKGGHTVIIDVDKYENEIEKMLANPCYTQMHNDPLQILVEKEVKIMEFFRTNHKTKGLMEMAYEPNTKQLAQLYGLPKVHKETFCLRPITALRSSPGHTSGRVFDKILNIIFPRTHFHVKDSYDMKEFLDRALISEDDVLVSFDVVSMYTNIPRELVRKSILEKQKEIFEKFGIGKSMLLYIMDFLLIESTIVTALGKTYKQVEGLPMGGCISTTLARIVMDRVVHDLISKVPNISFIRVFVDDTIAAMKRESVILALRTLNEFHCNIKFTHEMENARRSINFLNITLIRDGNLITTNWYRKYFASGRLLPYFSSHKRTTIIATAQGFIQTVLRLSDPFFYQINKPLVEKTLRNNGYPESTVMTLMNKFYTYMKPFEQSAQRDNKVKNYKIYPHAICESRRIKKVLHTHKRADVVYADSTKNTKINWVTTRKTLIPFEKRGNVVLRSICVCGRKMKFTHAGFNENGLMASKRIITTYKQCTGNLHAFVEVKYGKGLQYRKQNGYLMRYIGWKHRKQNALSNGLPNYHFTKVLAKTEKELRKRAQRKNMNQTSVNYKKR